ncbi:MAG TPA: hypothetical protein V6C69_18070 [Trichormus sp.]|jgi:hypothetical protein
MRVFQCAGSVGRAAAPRIELATGFLILLFVFSVCPAAFADPSELEKSPMLSTTVPDQAWHSVSSKSGHFTVLMPGEVRKSKHESAVHQSTSYFSSVQDGKSTDFFLSYTKHDASYLNRRSQDKLLKDAMELNVSLMFGKIVKRKYVDWHGNQAVEFEFVGYARSKKHSKEGRNCDLHGKGRIILANGLEYALICTTTKPGIGAACDKFLASFATNSTL